MCLVESDLVFSIDIPVGHKSCKIRILGNDTMQLLVANCLRKECVLDDRSCVLYVSSNIELYWEEHCYVEARYNSNTNLLRVSLNQQTVFEQVIP